MEGLGIHLKSGQEVLTEKMAFECFPSRALKAYKVSLSQGCAPPFVFWHYWN